MPSGPQNLDLLSISDLNAVDKWLEEEEKAAKDRLADSAVKARHPDAFMADGLKAGGKFANLHHLRQDIRRAKERRETPDGSE